MAKWRRIIIVQSDAIITRSNKTWYCIYTGLKCLYLNINQMLTTVNLAKGTPYLALNGELWCVYCKDLWSRYSGTTLYIDGVSQWIPSVAAVWGAGDDIWLPTFHIWWKFPFAVIQLLVIISQQNFTHATTAQLPCHVWNFVAITSFKFGWEQNVISITFELWWKDC